MDIDLNARRESLTDKDKTIELICEKAVQFFQHMPSPEIVDALDAVVRAYEKDSREAISELALNVAFLNLESIFELAESALEKIFLNALNIVAFPYTDICIFFTSQIDDIKQARFRESVDIQRHTFESWEKFKEIWEENDAKTFMDLLKEMDFLTDAQRIRMIWYILHEYVSTLYGMFQISLQVPIRDVLPGGRIMRPDIYIWHPYDPDFKLIVECDGYAYHSDKSSFSNDRARDRLLHMKGYKVLRFSGHDILTNPTEMAKELLQYLIDKKQEIKPIYLT